MKVFLKLEVYWKQGEDECIEAKLILYLIQFMSSTVGSSPNNFNLIGVMLLCLN